MKKIVSMTLMAGILTTGAMAYDIVEIGAGSEKGQADQTLLINKNIGVVAKDDLQVNAKFTRLGQNDVSLNYLISAPISKNETNLLPFLKITGGGQAFIHNKEKKETAYVGLASGLLWNINNEFGTMTELYTKQSASIQTYGLINMTPITNKLNITEFVEYSNLEHGEHTSSFGVRLGYGF